MSSPRPGSLPSATAYLSHQALRKGFHMITTPNAQTRRLSISSTNPSSSSGGHRTPGREKAFFRIRHKMRGKRQGGDLTDEMGWFGETDPKEVEDGADIDQLGAKDSSWDLEPLKSSGDFKAPVYPSEILRSLFKHGRTSSRAMAMRFFKELIITKKATNFSLNIVLKYWIGPVRNMLKLLELIGKEDVGLSKVTLGIAVTRARLEGDVELTAELQAVMKERGLVYERREAKWEDPEYLQHSRVSYARDLLLMYYKGGSDEAWESAKYYHNTLVSKGLACGNIWTLYLRYAPVSGKDKIEMLRIMQQTGVEPKSEHFSLVLTTLAVEHSIPEIINLLKVMDSRKIFPNYRCNFVLDMTKGRHNFRKSRRTMEEKGERFKDASEEVSRRRTATLSHLASMRKRGSAIARREAWRIFRKLQSHQVADKYQYNCMLQSFCVTYDATIRLWAEMLKAEVWADRISYETVYNTSLVEGNYSLVVRLMEHMFRHKVSMENLITIRRDKVVSKEKEELLFQLRDEKIRTMMKNGDYDELEQLLCTFIRGGLISTRAFKWVIKENMLSPFVIVTEMRQGLEAHENMRSSEIWSLVIEYALVEMDDLALREALEFMEASNIPLRRQTRDMISDEIFLANARLEHLRGLLETCTDAELGDPLLRQLVPHRNLAQRGLPLGEALKLVIPPDSYLQVVRGQRSALKAQKAWQTFGKLVNASQATIEHWNIMLNNAKRNPHAARRAVELMRKTGFQASSRQVQDLVASLEDERLAEINYLFVEWSELPTGPPP
eukprot:CAMPEP_0184502396 /NCGR_PEP_ID=MMETSP0113_2-20130426/50198_1 /TAXON_ID=91329 /ORGANISM="Norrisiella sphaerica, Strain BC52" /LENGTH=779 /DNA_ID=CAMNT_0026891557 /DNA_START=233 /DNA_END=2575 /DNA_ORIENTATION=+